jgi:aminopeptidase-like protein
LDIISILENNKNYLNLYPEGEPQLGKRGVNFIPGGKGGTIDTVAMFWILNLSDKNNSLLDISIRSKINFKKVKEAADILLEKKLIKEI